MMVGEQFNDANKELQEGLQTLWEVDFPDKDALMERIIDENAFTTTYIEQHDRLARGKITQDQFKANLMKALMANKEKEYVFISNFHLKDNFSIIFFINKTALF